MNNKAFFQILAIISFLVMIVFLFRAADPLAHVQLMVTGCVFVATAALSVLVGRGGSGGGHA